jgi:hypothetical protein
MFLAGFKFGLGFCLGTGVFTALMMATIYLSSWISQLLRTLKRSPQREERALKGVEWERPSISVPREDGSIQSFSFCSVIRWEGSEDRKKPHHRDGVRWEWWCEVEVAIGDPHEAAILRSVKQHKLDYLILSLEFRDANPRLCRVLSQFPQTLILAIGPKTLTVYWFEVIVRSERRGCSLQSILGLLRAKPTEQTARDRPTAAEGGPTASDIPAITPQKREHLGSNRSTDRSRQRPT